jgi:hypothetical protein
MKLYGSNIPTYIVHLSSALMSPGAIIKGQEEQAKQQNPKPQKIIAVVATITRMF